MSESFNGVDPGMNGRENTRFPTGTMTVEAMNNTLAEPNLCSREARGREQQNGMVLVSFPSNNSEGLCAHHHRHNAERNNIIRRG
jgi:hypothetical protein